jgi:DNA-binding SARP family transcriptional activator
LPQRLTIRTAVRRLALSFLGAPLVELNGSQIHLKRRKVLALLAYLAITGRRHTKDALAETFYPERTRERAYSGIRQTLSILRVRQVLR